MKTKNYDLFNGIFPGGLLIKQYLRYLWRQVLPNVSNELIYVPAETKLSNLESSLNLRSKIKK